MSPENIWNDFWQMDLLSLTPVDVISSVYYHNYPWLRLPRLLKVNFWVSIRRLSPLSAEDSNFSFMFYMFELQITTFWELFARLDTRLSSPFAARISKTLLYMLLRNMISIFPFKFQLSLLSFQFHDPSQCIRLLRPFHVGRERNHWMDLRIWPKRGWKCVTRLLSNSSKIPWNPVQVIWFDFWLDLGLLVSF